MDEQEQKIKEMEAEIARLTRLVHYDPLTDIFNRRGFLEMTERLFHFVSYNSTTIERRTGLQIPFSIIFLDVDHFKQINDTYGHGAGDEALKTVAATLHSNIRSGDILGRMGGEEFAVALVAASSHSGGMIAEKLRHAIEAVQFIWEGKHVPLTASFGVAEYQGEASLLEVIDKADKAMYRAKEAGRNRVVVS